MKDCELILAVSGIACGIINCYSDDDISILSVVFSQLGDTLATYLTQNEICNNRQSSKDNTNNSNNSKSNDSTPNDQNTKNSSVNKNTEGNNNSD